MPPVILTVHHATGSDHLLYAQVSYEELGTGGGRGRPICIS